MRISPVFRLAVLSLTLMLLLGGSACHAQTADRTPTPIPGTPDRPEDANMNFSPIVAGQFYPANPKQLAREVDGFIDGAAVPADLGPIFGLVAPHAGYVYSGPVAGYAYRAVKGARYDVVVVMGLSHRVPGQAAVLANWQNYDTPLGAVPIDRQAAAAVAKAVPFVETDDDMFRMEHSLEVQLPFIQRALPGTPVVPIVLGSLNRGQISQLAAGLDKVFAGRRALFVASTDLSHFRTYDSANQIDLETLGFLQRGDLAGLYAAPQTRERMCGLIPVTVLFELYKLRGGTTAVLLRHANSGDTSGDKSRVVGYGALALTTPTKAAGQGSDPSAADDDDYLSADEKKELLRIARETVETYVRTGRAPKFDITSENLLRDGAAFVTLQKQPGKQLRGCIGQILARMPLWECVRDMAVAAATQDPRFPAVKENELASLHIEISVLTPPVKVNDFAEIKVGTHGLIVSQGWRRGLLLPQVATEYGWDRDTFLTQTCFKAGLSGDCWHDKDTTIERFSAVVFSE